MNDFVLWYIMLNVTNLTKLKLIKKYGNEEYIFKNFENCINDFPTISKRFVNYNKNEELKKVNILKEFIIKENIGYITIGDMAYPNKLKEIKEPPYVLFYKGDISIISDKHKAVGIVGSRNCSSYGIRATSYISRELTEQGVIIISGGARGVDTIAHRECINSNGKTVAVLGCGINVVYPYENKELFNKVLRNGLIITEFLPDCKPLAYNFPRRNRIISALSDIVVVTEASEKSGSLITVDYALEQNKTIFTVPGSIFSKESKGCNRLNTEGANVFTDMIDLYLALGIKEDKNKILKYKENDEIIRIIGEEPIHINEIISRTNIDREALYSILFDLQIKKEIISLPGNFYAKIS
ncbi:MAG: DNA-processing protein DprA [Clostridium sp.]